MGGGRTEASSLVPCSCCGCCCCCFCCCCVEVVVVSIEGLLDICGFEHPELGLPAQAWNRMGRIHIAMQAAAMRGPMHGGGDDRMGRIHCAMRGPMQAAAMQAAAMHGGGDDWFNQPEPDEDVDDMGGSQDVTVVEQKGEGLLG